MYVHIYASIYCGPPHLSPCTPAAVVLLPEISRLSLLQGMLSKLPYHVLLMAEEGEGEGEGEGVCLHHVVLTLVCDLFDR